MKFLYDIYKKLKATFYSNLYWNPQKDFFIIWITWTDWKTTTVNLLQHVLNNFEPSASISTALIKIKDKEIENDKKMTSLDPSLLYKYLSIFKNEWIKYVVLEVSSHWLVQHRFHWIEFNMWILTNITPEHLDYHKTFENYVNAKKKLFINVMTNSKKPKYAVLPRDDETWRKWLSELSFDRVIDFSYNQWSIKADNVILWLDFTEFDIIYLWQKYHLKTNLIWKHNVYNILAVFSACILLWFEPQKIINAIMSFNWVPWRMQSLILDWVTYFIDFAHTPKALEFVLQYLSQLKKWRLIVLFWAPWERDKYKRPKMWEIVNNYADIIILTDDDPAGENRYDIIYQVRQWINRQIWDNFYIIPERKLAVAFAKKISKPWDIVLLAWKWHEKIQLTNFWKRSYSDYEEVIWQNIPFI